MIHSPQRVRQLLLPIIVTAIGLGAAAAAEKPAPGVKSAALPPPITIQQILEKETVTPADYKALQQSMRLSDERLARLQQQLEQVRKAQQREREELAKLANDPRAKPTHELWKVFSLTQKSPTDTVTNYCLDGQNRLLVCCGPERGMPAAEDDRPIATSASRGIHVLTPDGQTTAVWKLDFTPQAICVAPDGAIFAAGSGRIAKLDAGGNIQAVADTPQAAERKKAPQPNAASPVANVDDEQPSVSILDALSAALSGKDLNARRQQQSAEQLRFEAWRYSQVAGLAASGQDLFVCCPSSGGFSVYRVDHTFSQPRKILQGLAGCCGQMDIHVRGNDLYVAENGRFRVSRYDRDGKLLSSWGRGERVGLEGFSGCCNPKNIRFGAGDVVYTSESGPPQRIKRHTLDGKFLDVVALPKFQGGCVRVTVAVSADHSRVYVLDTSGNQLHAFIDRRMLPTHKQVRSIDLRQPGEGANVRTFCCDGRDRLLVGMGGQSFTYALRPDGGGVDVKSVEQPCQIKLFDLDGQPRGSWKLDVTPQALAAGAQAIYVGGAGRLARLDRAGHVLQTVDAPNMAENLRLLDETLQRRAEEARAEMPQPGAVEKGKESKPKPPFDLAAERAKLLGSIRQRSAVSGIAVAQRDLFVACSGRSGFDIYRMDHDLGHPQKIVERLVGCCGQMDIQACGEGFCAAENVRKQVGCYDREGRRLSGWGQPERGDEEGFGSCCNPMNIRLGPGGEVFTSESGLGRIKRFATDGKFLGLVGTAAVGGGCKHVPLALAPNGKRIFVLNASDAQLLILDPDATAPPQTTAQPQTAASPPPAGGCAPPKEDCK